MKAEELTLVAWYLVLENKNGSPEIECHMEEVPGLGLEWFVCKYKVQ